MTLCIHLVGPSVGDGVALVVGEGVALVVGEGVALVVGDGAVVVGDGVVGVGDGAECGVPPLGLEVGILVGVFRQRQRVGALVGILY